MLSDSLQLNGIRLVIDRPDDLEILARPPWWTPTRLAIVIAVLLIALAVFALWNWTLRRLSEKRGRELFHERSANAMSELKTEERTRLAVELHDSISQILTGRSSLARCFIWTDLTNDCFYTTPKQRTRIRQQRMT